MTEGQVTTGELPPVSFEAKGTADEVASALAKVFDRTGTVRPSVLRNLPLRGRVTGSQVTIWREPGFRNPWLEFRGEVVQRGDATRLEGVYYDLKAVRRVMRTGVLGVLSIFFIVVALLAHDPETSVPLAFVAAAVAATAVVVHRFYILNRTGERDLLRRELGDLLSRLT